MHWYTPEAFRLIFDKISMLLIETTIPVLSMIHPILGTGLPVALHSSVTSSPSRTGEEHWRNVTFGATEKHKMQIWALDWNYGINSSFYDFIDGRFLLQNVKQQLLTKQSISNSHRGVNSKTIVCLTAVTTRLHYPRSLLRFIRYKFSDVDCTLLSPFVHVMSGLGLPVILQNKVKLLPSNAI